MATDRFAELGPPVASSSLCEPEPEPQESERIDALREFNEIKAAIAGIEAGVVELVQVHKDMGVAVFDAANAREKAEGLRDEIAQAGLQVKGRLKVLGDQLKAAQEVDAEVVHQVSHKMRRNMHMTATTKLVLVMGRFQDEQAAFKKTQQQTARRQLKLVKPDASEEVRHTLIPPPPSRSLPYTPNESSCHHCVHRSCSKSRRATVSRSSPRC